MFNLRLGVARHHQFASVAGRHVQVLSLAGISIHDLKLTFGRRLRAAGVRFDDRQDLLGHKSGRVATHYSAAELENLLEASNQVCAV